MQRAWDVSSGCLVNLWIQVTHIFSLISPLKAIVPIPHSLIATYDHFVPILPTGLFTIVQSLIYKFCLNHKSFYIVSSYYESCTWYGLLLSNALFNLLHLLHWRYVQICWIIFRHSCCSRQINFHSSYPSKLPPKIFN